MTLSNRRHHHAPAAPTTTTAQYAPTTTASSGVGGSTATFRTIRRTFWTDPYIESMPPARKLLYIYLFTSPHANNLGVLNTTARRIAFETGMAEEEVKEHLSILEQQDGKIALDGGGGSCGGLSILVVNFIKHQCTTSPKLVMSLRALFRSVESEKIKAVLIAKNPHLLDGMDRVSDTVSIPFGERDQDQIQEKREEIRSFPCCGDGDGEKGKGRQGKGYDTAVTLGGPLQLQLNTDTPKKGRKGYVQYTPPSSPQRFITTTAAGASSASPVPLAVATVVDNNLQDIPLDLLEALQQDYPTIDVSKEIDRAREWARRHTSPEKPLRNAWRFITAWLRNAVAAATTTVREKEKGSACYAAPQKAHKLDDWASEKKNMAHGKGQTVNAPEKPSSWTQTPPPSPQQQPQRPQQGRQHEAVEHHFPTPEQLEENAQRGLAFLARWKKEHGYGLA